MREPFSFPAHFYVQVDYLPGDKDLGVRSRDTIGRFAERFQLPSVEVADLHVWRGALVGGQNHVIRDFEIESIDQVYGCRHEPVMQSEAVVGFDLVAVCAGRLRYDLALFDNDLLVGLPKPTLVALASTVVEDGMTGVLIAAAKKVLGRT